MGELSSTDRAYLDQALEHIHNQNFGAALPTLENLKRTYPDNPQVNRWLEVCRKAVGAVPQGSYGVKSNDSIGNPTVLNGNNANSNYGNANTGYDNPSYANSAPDYGYNNPNARVDNYYVNSAPNPQAYNSNFSNLANAAPYNQNFNNQAYANNNPNFNGYASAQPNVNQQPVANKKAKVGLINKGGSDNGLVKLALMIGLPVIVVLLVAVILVAFVFNSKSGGGSTNDFKGVPVTILSDAGTSNSNNEIDAMAWSSDGKELATGIANGNIDLWNSDGTLIRTLKQPSSNGGGNSAIKAIAWSPDNQTLATGNYNGLELWKAATGAPIVSLNAEIDNKYGLAWSPDGKEFAAISNSGVQLWHADGTPIVTLTPTDNSNSSSHRGYTISWSADSKMLATTYENAKIYLWTAEGKAVTNFGNTNNRGYIVFWSPDNKTLATATDGNIQLWRSDGAPIVTLSGQTDNLSDGAWSPDGKFLAVSYEGGQNNGIQLWHSDGTPIVTLDVPYGNDSNITTTPLATANAASTSSANSVPVISGEVRTITWSSDSKLLAAGLDNGGVQLWHADGTRAFGLKNLRNEVTSIAWSPDGKLLAAASDDGSVQLWK